MKAFLGVVVAIVIWLPATVIGWGMGTAMQTGTGFALVATATPAAALAIVFLISRALKWREFGTAVLITSAILVTICGMCNFSSIEHGRPPRIAG